MAGATTNNIWDSILKTGKATHAPYAAIMDAHGLPGTSMRQKANAMTAANAVSGAAPNNTKLAQYNQNTLPWNFGSFPQNNGKPTPGGQSNATGARTFTRNIKRRD